MSKFTREKKLPLSLVSTHEGNTDFIHSLTPFEIQNQMFTNNAFTLIILTFKSLCRLDNLICRNAHFKIILIISHNAFRNVLHAKAPFLEKRKCHMEIH